MAIRTITHSREILSVILGGGAGSRLYPLTASRSKPAVPIAGKYRLVDIPISNCLNNGIGRMFVLTQFNSASLNRHIKNTYHFSAFSKAFVDILAAEQTPDNPALHDAKGRMAVLLGSVIRNRNLARNHNLECGTHELLHCHHERAIRP